GVGRRDGAATRAAAVDFLHRHPEVVTDLQQALFAAAAAVNGDPAQAAADAAGVLEMPPAVLEQSIRWSHLVARPAREARASLEAMYGEIATLRPDVIGGRLPDSEFYL